MQLCYLQRIFFLFHILILSNPFSYAMDRPSSSWADRKDYGLLSNIRVSIVKGSFESLLQDVKINDITLTSLSLDDERYAGDLVEALRRNTTLTELSLEYCWGISNKDYVNLLSVIQSHKTLLSLNLSATDIPKCVFLPDFQGKSLINKLSYLQELYLADNKLGDQEAAILSQNRTLALLDLSNNKITSEGAKQFATSLKENSRLVNLDLSENKIDEGALEYFGDMLKSNNTLKLLGLKGLNIKEERLFKNRIQNFIESIKANKSLTSINCLSNPAPPINTEDQTDWKEYGNVTDRQINLLIKYLNRNSIRLPSLDLGLLLIAQSEDLSSPLNIDPLTLQTVPLLRLTNQTYLHGFTPELPLKGTQYEASVMAIDPAGLGGDEVGFAIVKKYGNHFFVTKLGGIINTKHIDTMRKLREYAQKEAVTNFIVESNFAAGVYADFFEYYLSNEYPQGQVKRIRSTDGKESRIINTLLPVLQKRQLIISRKVIDEDLVLLNNSQQEYSVIHQLLNIHTSQLKHDDRVDALALAISDLNPPLIALLPYHMDNLRI